MEERCEDGQRERRWYEPKVRDTLTTKKRNGAAECALGVVEPSRSVLVRAELVMKITQDITAANGEEALDNPVVLELPEPFMAKRLDDARGVTRNGSCREKGVKHLSSADSLASRINSIEHLSQ